MPKIFVSHQDLTSFLTAALQFGRREAAQAYAAKRGWDASEDAFKFFTVGDGTYQPRNFYELNTSLLDADSRLARDAHRPRFQTLRDVGSPMPEGARNTCLLVDGPRMFHRYIHETKKQRPYYYQFASNDFMCFASWGREGHPLGSPLFEEDGRRVFVGRSGRGAIYASVPRFSSDLSIVGYDTHLVLVEFSILDRDPSKDDVLRYTSRVLKSYGFEGAGPCKSLELDSNRYDAFWQELAQRAFTGFVKNCQPMPSQLASEVERFRDQTQKAEAERKAPYGASFRDRIKDLNWQDALRMVEEPWQLEVVIHEIDGPTFYESPMYSGTLGNRVRNMLKAHECSEERRGQLRDMIGDFVAPRSNIWSYSGD